VILQKLRRSGNGYVVTIPKAEVERRGWKEGQLLGIQLTEMETRPVPRPDLRQTVEDRWARNEPALRYLADR